MATILIVDDEPQLRQVIRTQLEEQGYHLVEASSGQEALALAYRVNPDLILLDVIMPDLDGLEVCRILKRNEATRSIPVVLLTFREGLEDRIQGLDAGASDYLTKPVQPDELLARVKAHLRTRQLWEDLEQRQQDFASLLELSKAVASTLRSPEIFRLIVERSAQLIDASRCSLVVIGEGNEGYVVASTDDSSITHLPILLERYPEIQEAVRRVRPVIVEDVTKDPLMAGVRDALVGLEFRSILVAPINLRATVVGTLVLRSARAQQPFTPREVELCEFIAELSAIPLQNAHLFESLELTKMNLERLTLIDDLTEVYNRRFLFRKLYEEVERARRYGHGLCCIMLDVDNFKQVNDQYGHARGDSVLKELATVVQLVVRRSDIFARYGGEEFVLLLPQTDAEGAMVEANRIQCVVRDHVFRGIEASLKLTISQGIACYPLNSNEDPNDLLKLADAALYKAKHAGKDTIACAWKS